MQTWYGNIDIDAVFDHYKVKTYTCSNLFKQEDECSHAIEQALTEFIEENLDKRHTLAYATKIECSKKKAVYQIILEFWLRKIFPGYIYANINTPEKRFTMMSNQKGISNLPDESMEILKKKHPWSLPH